MQIGYVQARLNVSRSAMYRLIWAFAGCLCSGSSEPSQVGLCVGSYKPSGVGYVQAHLSLRRSVLYRLVWTFAGWAMCRLVKAIAGRLCRGLSEPLHVCYVQARLNLRRLVRNRYNQAPHLTQITNGKVTTSQLDITNESQRSRWPQGINKHTCMKA